MARIGYVRVSTVDQNDARQLDGVPLDKVFADKASGKDAKRPELQRALEYVREGDVLVVHSMDRLARNLDDLRKIVFGLIERGVWVEFVKEKQTYTGERNDQAVLMLSIMGALGEFERANIRERQREGIAVAKRKGNVYKGRKPSLSPAKAIELRAQVAAGNVNKAELARKFGISRAALYVYLKGDKAAVSTAA